MKLIAFVLLAGLVSGCAQTNYQQYEGRGGPPIFEGQGGTKEVVGGYEIWDNGTPPRRYQVIGVVTIEDNTTRIGRYRMRSALAEEIRKAGGDAAVVMDSATGPSGSVVGVNSRGALSVGAFESRVSGKWQIVKYLDAK